MSDRNDILLGLSRGLGGSPKSRGSAVASRLRKNAQGVVPKRGVVRGKGLIDLFVSQAEGADAVCERVGSLDGVVGVVRGHIKEHGLGSRIWLSGQDGLGGLRWGRGFDFVDGVGGGDSDDLLGLSIAYCGIAETGSLVFLSGGGLSLSQNFLCRDHVVILFVGDIVGCYEDLVDGLGGGFVGSRGMVFVTGPSRTGDIAQTLELGAHGALRLRIVLVDKR